MREGSVEFVRTDQKTEAHETNADHVHCEKSGVERKALVLRLQPGMPKPDKDPKSDDSKTGKSSKKRYVMRDAGWQNAVNCQDCCEKI